MDFAWKRQLKGWDEGNILRISDIIPESASPCESQKDQQNPGIY
jgi:hypothetical protein